MQTVAGIPYHQLDTFHELILMDEMARLPSGVAIALGGASNVGVPPVLHAGTEAQKRRWLPGLFDWSTSFCLAITEATAGSDVSAVRTSAVRTPDGAAYVVKWVTGAPWATHMTTAVRTRTSTTEKQVDSDSDSAASSGISVLVIPLNSPGVSIRKIHNTGHNAGGSSWVELTDVRVPVANRLGPEGGGFALVLRNFNKERLILAADCNRQARACLSEALRHAHDRETFGKPLASRQIGRFKLVALARDIEAHWTWWNRLRITSRRRRRGGRPKTWRARRPRQDAGGPGRGARGPRVAAGARRARLRARPHHDGAGLAGDVRLKVIGGGSEEILSDLAWREEHKMAAAKAMRRREGARL